MRTPFFPAARAAGRYRAIWARARAANPVIAAVIALVVAAAITLVAAVVTAPRLPGAPAQQSGTAAGRPHRVAASATIAGLDGDTLVPAARARPAGAPARAAQPPRGRRRPKDAVPPAARPPRLKLGASAARGHDRVRTLRSPAGRRVAGFNSRTSRVLPAGTSANRLTYQNADGTRTAMIYQSPVNYRRPDGSWASIDASLVPAGSAPAAPSPSASITGALASPAPPGSAASTPTLLTPSSPAGWQEQSAAEPEKFAPFADGRPVGLLPVTSADSVGLAVQGAAQVAGRASGNTVTYPGVRPDTDLRFVAGAGMLDEQLILNSAGAPASWVLPLRLRGLAARTGPGGVIEFINPAGRVIAVMPHGLMTDAKIDPRSGDGATSAGVGYTLTTADGQPAIRMTLDASWLHAAARQFPVTVDPGVQAFNSNGTTYAQKPGAGDFSGDTEIHVGTFDGGTDVARSFLKFDSVSSSLANDNVLGVRLGLFDSWSFSCSPRTVEVYPVTSSWSVTGSKTYPGPVTGRAVGSKSFATGWVPEGSTTSPCPSAWQGIDLNEAGTQLVNGWTHGTTPNDGLALGASATDSFAWKKFTSDNATNGDPFLSVTYTPDGARYDLAATQPVQQVTPTQNGQIAIRVTNTGSATWTPTNGYELSYEAFNARGKLVTSHPVFTPMPSSVAPGASVTVNAKVNELPVGSYAIDFDMYSGATGSAPVSFLSQGVAPFAVGLSIPQPPPVVTGVYPPTGYISPTVTPQLTTTASSTTGSTISYQFSLTCQPLPGSTCAASTVNSPKLSTPYWTTPALSWNEPYTWTVTATTGSASATIGPVTITPEVPQPALTAGLGGSSGQAFDPQSGNFTTRATDAAVAVAGPPLEIDRTYNSLDPEATGGFGAGWSSVLDTAVVPDSDGSGNVVVALPDGQQLRFGFNSAAGTYAPPMGSPDVLTHNAGGTWTLMDASGNQYGFTSGGVLDQITDRQGLAQNITSNSARQVTTITDAASGRALHLTWSTPGGAGHPHVASVATDPPASGQSGASGLTWTYSYTGDELTGACGPSGGCTSYSYAAGSNYRAAVLDAAPRSDWQLGDAPGSASAADEVDANLGTTAGTYSNVTLGAAGPLAGSSETAASFNGTSSSVALPASLVADQDYVSVGLWFKGASPTASGVLFGYQADALSNSSGNTAARDPALYVGGNGKLYGELWNGSIDPMSSSASVDDGKWHYAVLTGSGTSQSLWLDGTQVATMAGQISPDGLTNDTAGAGFWGTGWPEDFVSSGPSLQDTPIGYFSGSIGQVAIYPRPLGQAAIAQQYGIAASASAELTQVTMPSGRVSQQAAYSAAQDRIATYTDPAGGPWQVHEPLATGLKPTSDSLGEVTRYVTVVDPAGRSEVYGFDALNRGRMTSFSRGNGDAPQTFGYDAAGFLNQVQDSDGNLVTFTNDIHGNVLSRSWFPVAAASSGSSAKRGAEAGAGAGGARAGPTASAATPASASSCTTTGATCTSYFTYFYNGGNPLDPRNDELTGAADARSASAADTTYLTRYAYNASGELVSSTTPATSDFPSGRTTSYAYSTTATSASGGGTTPAGLLVSRTTPGGAVTADSYHSDGDLAQVTRPSGLRTVYTYDALGRPLTSETFSDAHPSGLTTSYTYTGLNQPATSTDPGVTNAVTGVTHTLQTTDSYDADGNLTQQAQADLTGGDATRTTTYTYNDFGERDSVTDPAGDTTGYTYDDSGHIAGVADADGNEYGYAYNEYGEVTQETLTSNSTDQSNPGGSSSLVLASYAYDPAGLLASATDAMGRATNYFYNGDEELIAAQNLTSSGSGRQTAYTYDGAGNLIDTDASDDPVTHQTVTSYAFDAADRVTSVVVDPTPAGTSASGYANRTTSYAYNADNDVTSATVTGAGGSSATRFSYDSSGDLTSQAVQEGSTSPTTTWTYNEFGQQASMTSPDGNAAGATPANFTTSYAYDQAGNPAQATGPPVATQSYSAQAPATTRPVTTDGYDTFGDQTQAQDPDGNVTAARYDGDGRVTSVTRPSYFPPGATSAVTATTSYTYDGLGHRTSVTDPLGNATSYAYDTLGDVTSRTDPQLTGQASAGTWTYAYDDDGEPLSAISPAGAETQATYDGFGDQLTSTQDIRTSSGTQANTTSATYNYLGNPLTVTTPDGTVTTATYDHLGELASAADAFGDTTSYAYNYAGRVAQINNPDGTLDTFGYDAAGHPTSSTAFGSSSGGQLPPVLAAQTQGYDPSGNHTSGTDPMGAKTSYGYNAAGELTSSTQPVSSSASNTASYGYDPAGNQTSITDGRGNTTWTTYNPWGLPESVIEPATPAAPAAAQRTWTTSYDADGRAASVSQPGAISLSYGYDQLGDLTSEHGSGAAAATPAQSFGYNTSGQLTSATAPGGSDHFSYNDAGTVAVATGPSGNSAFTYNADGLMTSRSDAAGLTSYTYDKADRPATAADPLTGATLSYGYNADSLPATISYAKGGGTGPAQSLTYNGLQQLTGDALTSAAGTAIASASYGYNADGDLTSQATTGSAGAGSTSYSYNEADQLTSAAAGSSSTGYSYDADGDLAQAGGTSYSYNAQDQVTSSTGTTGTTSYGYTLSGALSSVTPPSGPAQDSTSDAYGQTITAPGGIGYAYDGLGRLATRSTGAATQNFAYSGAGSTLASDGDTYSYDVSGNLLGEHASGGTAESTLSDLHGDVTGAFSPATGTTSLAASAAYGPYGAVTASAGAMASLGDQGQYTDPATGDTDMSARWYSPSTGRFTSNDTMGGVPLPSTVDGNPYAYADGNPLTGTDPTGHFCEVCILTGAETGAEDAGAAGIETGPWDLAIATGGALVGGLLGFWLGGRLSGSSPSRARGGGPAPCNISCGGPPLLGLEPGWGGSPSEPSWGVSFAPGTGYGWTGYGPCGSYCYTPPPPPPPQDCFAGPDPSCHPPAAPKSLRDGKYESDPARNTTNPRDIPRARGIDEPTPTEDQLLKDLHEQTAGITADPAENGADASSQGASTNASPQDPSSDVGNPDAPEPSGNPAADGGSGGAGNPPTTTPPAPDVPEPEPAGPRFVVDSGGTVTDTTSPAGAGPQDVFHVTASSGATQSVVNGIDPQFLNEASRFGPAFYVADDPATALSEVASHGGGGGFGIRFAFDSGAANILDLTDSEIAAEYGYAGGPITEATQAIGDKAAEDGFNVIRFASLRGDGVNFAILGDFDELLSPQMITPLG